MSSYKRGRRRKLKGNAVLAVTTVILACAVIVAVVILFHKSPASGAGSGSGSSSSKPSSQSSESSSVPSSSSSVPSSSTPSSSAPSSSSSQSSSTVSVSPAAFKDSVFVGDSLTEGLSLYGEMDDATVLGETGMSAYTAVAHTFNFDGKQEHVADAVAAKKPQKIYVLLGSNDIAEGYTAAKFVNYYEELLNSIKDKCPDAKLYVQSVFPVTAGYEKKEKSPGVYVTNTKIDAFNTSLESMCKSLGVTYLDVASVLKGSDGKLPDSASDDGMHLRKAYYDKWFAYLASHL